MKILLTLSEHESALAYQSTLRSKGHIVVTCYTGEKSIQTYRKRLGHLDKADSSDASVQAFDVTLLDCEIGDMDALELGRQILSLNPKQRIILASANIQETISRVLREFDMPAQILQKPISSELLVASLEDGGLDKELRKFKTELLSLRKALEINEV